MKILITSLAEQTDREEDLAAYVQRELFKLGIWGAPGAVARLIAILVENGQLALFEVEEILGTRDLLGEVER